MNIDDFVMDSSDVNDRFDDASELMACNVNPQVTLQYSNALMQRALWIKQVMHTKINYFT